MLTSTLSLVLVSLAGLASASLAPFDVGPASLLRRQSGMPAQCSPFCSPLLSSDCDDACGCTSAGLDLLDRCIQCSLDAGATTPERAEALERDARSICATAGPATKTPSATSSRSSSTSTSPFPGFTPAPGSSGNAGSKNSVGGAAGVVAGVLLVAAAL